MPWPRDMGARHRWPWVSTQTKQRAPWPVAEAPALEADEELRSGPKFALALPHSRSPHLQAQPGHTWRLGLERAGPWVCRTTRSCILHSCLLCVGLAGCSRDLAAWTGHRPSSQGPGGEVPPPSHMAARDRSPPSDPCGGYSLLRGTGRKEPARRDLCHAGVSPEGNLVKQEGSEGQCLKELAQE